MAEFLYYERNKWLRSVIAFVVATAIFISFVVFRPVESKAFAISATAATIALVGSMALICGLMFYEDSIQDSMNTGWRQFKRWSEDFCEKIASSANTAYQDFLSTLETLSADITVTEEPFATVEVPSSVLSDFIPIVEDLYDVNLTLQDSLSTSLTVGTRYVMPLESSLSYVSVSQSSLPYYTLGNLIAVSSLSLGLNLIYCSDICSLYFYKTDSNTVFPVFKIGDYYVRTTTSISSVSNYVSLVPIVTYYNSSGSQVTLDSFLGKGYGYYRVNDNAATLAIEYSEVLSCVRLYISAIDSSGVLNNLNLKLGLSSDRSIGLYASPDLASLVELTDCLDWNDFCTFSNFTSKYIGNYLNKVSFTLKGIEINDYVFPFTEARAITEFEFRTQILYHLLNWSLGFTDAAIGSLVNETFDVVIDSDYLTSKDNELTESLGKDVITVQVPSDLDSLVNQDTSSETVAVPIPSEIVIDDSDVGTETDPDGSGSSSSDNETLIIPDVDTSGILHYVESFLSGIAPFFTFLGSLIMALPTELVFIVFGGLIICIIVGFLSLII